MMTLLCATRSTLPPMDDTDHVNFLATAANAVRMKREESIFFHESIMFLCACKKAADKGEAGVPYRVESLCTTSATSSHLIRSTCTTLYVLYHVCSWPRHLVLWVRMGKSYLVYSLHPYDSPGMCSFLACSMLLTLFLQTFD